jgi:hypothetical protein
MESTKFFTAIFFNSEKKAYKYRNISAKEPGYSKFLDFAQSKQAVEVNFYDKNTRKFVKKVIF